MTEMKLQLFYIMLLREIQHYKNRMTVGFLRKHSPGVHFQSMT